MLCIAALSQVNPPLHLSQKLGLAKAGLPSIIALPPITPSLDRKDGASLYIQTFQALDDMLQAPVGEHLEPSMVILQNFLEHVAEFSMSGQLMGTLGVFCMNPNQEVSMGAPEAPHYLFKILVLHRSVKHKTENTLKDLQTHFRAEWFADIQDLTMPALCHTATLMRWSKLKAIFAEKDVWTVLRAPLKREESKVLWFLKQTVMLFKSPQAHIRQAAVWFAGQIVQTLSEEEAGEAEETYAALKHVQEDPDPAVSCLAAQTSYVLEAPEKMKVPSPQLLLQETEKGPFLSLHPGQTRRWQR